MPPCAVKSLVTDLGTAGIFYRYYVYINRNIIIIYYILCVYK